MHATIIRPTSVIAATGIQYVVSAISSLREAEADLDVALACSNISSLYAAGPKQLRDLYRDLDALLAQLGAMRLQFAEYVQASEDEAGPEVPQGWVVPADQDR
jgi:hypothetical protein